jgi:hypothetical protein
MGLLSNIFIELPSGLRGVYGRVCRMKKKVLPRQFTRSARKPRKPMTLEVRWHDEGSALNGCFD